MEALSSSYHFFLLCVPVSGMDVLADILGTSSVVNVWFIYLLMIIAILKSKLGKKDLGSRNQVHEETFPSPTGSTRITTGCGTRPTSLWVHRNLFWQLSIAWLDHVVCHNSLTKTIFHGEWATPWSAEEMRRGRQRKCWMDNI